MRRPTGVTKRRGTRAAVITAPVVSAVVLSGCGSVESPGHLYLEVTDTAGLV